VRGACLAEAGGVNQTTTTITLELELDGDTVGGHTVDANGVRREFRGWIGLMGVLDALLDGARKASLPTTPQGGTNAHR
jgi:hypothetical protein